MRTKRAADADSPSGSPVKGSPKKAKSPPKKAKEEQILTFGQPCIIQYFRCSDCVKAWQVVNNDDKSDAFIKNIVDIVRGDPSCDLRKIHGFRGDVSRRVSLSNDEVMKNHRKSYERKFLLQIYEDESPEADLAAAREIYSVSIWNFGNFPQVSLILTNFSLFD